MKVDICKINDHEQGFLRKSPRGLGFLFGFLSETSKIKTPSPGAFRKFQGNNFVFTYYFANNN